MLFLLGLSAVPCGAPQRRDAPGPRWLPSFSAQETPSAVKPPPPREGQTTEPAQMEPAKKEALAPGEKERLQRAHGLAAQMKVFTDVASQYMSVIRDAANQEDTTRLKDTADGLVAVYRQADQHIQQSPEKKKHKHLKKFEIALREQVSLLKSLQSLSSAAQRDLFTAAIAAGEALRKKVLGIIFEGGYTKKS